MSDTTTVRVRTTTRDDLNVLAAETGASADDVIRQGLALIRREQWRRQAEQDARAAANDPADRAEVAAALADLLGE